MLIKKMNVIFTISVVLLVYQDANDKTNTILKL